MTPSEQCKAAGLKSLAQLSIISGISQRTLINWHKKKPNKFHLLIIECRDIKNEKNRIDLLVEK